MEANNLSVSAESRVWVGRVHFRRGPSSIGTGPVSLSECMSSSDQGHCLGVVHSHATKGVSDLNGTDIGIWTTEWAGGVHVDKAESGRAKRRLAVAIHGTRELFGLKSSRSELLTVSSIRIVNSAATETQHWAYT